MYLSKRVIASSHTKLKADSFFCMHKNLLGDLDAIILKDSQSSKVSNVCSYVTAYCLNHDIPGKHFIPILSYFGSIQASFDTIDVFKDVAKFIKTRSKLSHSQTLNKTLTRRLLIQMSHSHRSLTSMYVYMSYEWYKNPASTSEFYDIDECIIRFINNRYIYDALRDNYLRHSYPSVHDNATRALGLSVQDRHKTLKSLVEKIDYLLVIDIKFFYINCRVKALYSIIDKMKKKNMTLEQLIDKHAIRIVTESIDDCYKALDVINKNFFPAKEHHKDYIQKPKSNGYRSIHSVIHHPVLGLVEIQIRTKAMHTESKTGDAAHSIYKSVDGKLTDIDKTLFERFLSFSDKLDLNRTRHTYALTPQNKIIELPKQATPIDFGFAVHTDIGQKCSGAKINGKLVPLSTLIKDGDIIEIIVNDQHIPPRSWLDKGAKLVHSKRAIKKIRSFHQIHFSDSKESQSIVARLKILAKSNGIDADIDSIANMHGYKHTSAFLKMLNMKSNNEIKSFLSPPKKSSSRLKKKSADKLQVNIAKCCYPTPEDKIIGYISHKGCYIHRESCRQLYNQSEMRKVHLNWSDISSETPELRFYISFVEVLPERIRQLLSELKTICIKKTQAKRLCSEEHCIKNSPYLRSFDKIVETCNNYKDNISVYRVGIKLKPTSDETKKE